MPKRLADILQRTPPVVAELSAQAVFNIFLSSDALSALAIIDDGKPVGLVTRARLAEQLAGPEGRALLADQPISLLMQREFVVETAECPVAAAAKCATETKSQALTDGVVVVHNGRYAGLVSAPAILEAVAKENTARARAMKKASAHRKAEARELNDRMLNKSRFLATLSHEIRTPLTGMLGIADLLVDANLKGEHRRYANVIASSGRMLDRLLTDMLDFSRMEAGKLSLNAEPLNLRDFANEARDLWTSKTADKDLALRMSIARGSKKRILADGVRLRQILFNLMSNALKFTDKGYVDVELSTYLSDAGSLMLRMKVSDTGCGIADEHKQRLFKEFEQVSPRTAAIYGGSGLGLAIAKGLSELMGGSITLEDNPDGGSIFTVDVGVEAIGPRLAVDNPSRMRRGRLELGEILVIEDHRVSQLVIEKALTAAGWKVDCVFTGEQGLRRAGGKRYQAILIDRHLPDGMGEDLLTRIRSEVLACYNVPALVVTADVTPERQESCRRSGFDGFIPKPIRPRELVAALADAVMLQESGQIVRRVNAV